MNLKRVKMPVTKYDALTLVWWSEVYNQQSPCNPSITRLCDSMHRELPIKGNPARRALTSVEQEKMTFLADGKIKTPGDVWHRNVTLLCLDLTTALRIGDVLRLKHNDLTWCHNPLRLKIWLADGKKDKWSSGSWSNEYLQSIHPQS